MGGDAPDTRADSEGDLDEIVNGRLVAGRAERAIVIVGAQRLQRGMRIEHAATAWAEHVPGEIEHPEPRGVQEARHHLLLIEAGPAREIEQVNAVERAVLAVLDQVLDRIDDARIGGLLQHRKQRLGFAHGVGLKFTKIRYAFNAVKSI